MLGTSPTSISEVNAILLYWHFQWSKLVIDVQISPRRQGKFLNHLSLSLSFILTMPCLPWIMIARLVPWRMSGRKVFIFKIIFCSLLNTACNLKVVKIRYRRSVWSAFTLHSNLLFEDLVLIPEKTFEMYTIPLRRDQWPEIN